MLYPLKFTPVFKDKIWGGKRIGTSLGLDFSPLPNCGEAWMLSGVAGCQTVVANGFLAGNELNEVLEVYMDELVGEKVYDTCGGEFPILIKFIDAADWLSVQVHPDDELAARRKIGNGKTEMWYVLDAEPGAELISGFNKPLDLRAYLDAFEHGRLKEILNYEKVSRDDLFFIPAGKVHALGPGILLAEIQQTSDTTYRIYDWDRKDSEGNPRELHTDLAVEAIDFSDGGSGKTTYSRHPNEEVALVECPAFTTNLLECDKPVLRDYSGLDSFVIYVCTEGRCIITSEGDEIGLSRGEVLLLPAVLGEVMVLPQPGVRILEVSIR